MGDGELVEDPCPVGAIPKTVRPKVRGERSSLN